MENDNDERNAINCVSLRSSSVKMQEEIMAKLMNLQEWAAQTYTHPPSLSTLRRWVREGRIYPSPEIHGKEYKLIPESVYVDPRKKMMKRKPSHVVPPKEGSLMEKLKHVEQAQALRR